MQGLLISVDATVTPVELNHSSDGAYLESLTEHLNCAFVDMVRLIRGIRA